MRPCCERAKLARCRRRVTAAVQRRVDASNWPMFAPMAGSATSPRPRVGTIRSADGSAVRAGTLAARFPTAAGAAQARRAAIAERLPHVHQRGICFARQDKDETMVLRTLTILAAIAAPVAMAPTAQAQVTQLPCPAAANQAAVVEWRATLQFGPRT